MSDDNHDARLLLGFSGWPHPEWEGRYFPEDLPGDWQFAYYANEAGCLLLPAGDWQALQPGEVAEWLEDCPDWFRFYMEWPDGDDAGALVRRAGWFGDRLGAILAPGAVPAGIGDTPVWRPRDDRHWVDGQGRVRLVRLQTTRRALRVLRDELAALPPGVRALVVEDESPARLGELRTLCELLGIA